MDSAERKKEKTIPPSKGSSCTNKQEKKHPFEAKSSVGGTVVKGKKKIANDRMTTHVAAAR